eukprot:TRINITY_DN4745_c1_g5_i1.p1 TRINITY_DN4745_c1_g5~~TRINITY_DN4745_c1_g5_i1.p1  ORF type:complete len:160 (+),score=19.56 TRINITY_DN4745_c1_g5_i1:27-482(+)
MDPLHQTGLPLTMKSDVFSFGVVLLELVSGREPLNHERPRDEWSIVEWARPQLKAGNIKVLVDPTLGDNWSMAPMWKMVEIAMLCVEPLAENRPTMSEVVRELKEATDMEFGMQSYLAGPSSGENGPRAHHSTYSVDLTPGADMVLNTEAR